MNGFVSGLAKSIYVGACLFVGFAAGMSPQIQIPKLLLGFKTQEVSVNGLAWISQVGEIQLQASTLPAPQNIIEELAEITPVQVPAIEKVVSRKVKANTAKNMLKLGKMVNRLEQMRPISEDEFQQAAINLQSSFFSAIQDPKKLVHHKEAAPKIELVQTPVEEVVQTLSSAEKVEEAPKDLTEESKWQESLLVAQVAAQEQKWAQKIIPPVVPNKGARKTPPTESAHHVAKAETPKPNKLECAQLVNHKFFRAINSPSDGVDIQICPERLEWISKSWEGRGWVKATQSGYFPTLSRVTGSVASKALVLDENAMADLVLKGGVNLAKGSGVIVGVLPDGYSVEFMGRAEEPQYFELNQQKYFAILNAEPGSGVISLSEKNHGEASASIFVPVLEDTISYLDLVAPTRRNIQVKIVKNATKHDAEIFGLVVSLSTQMQSQAITNANGEATIKNIYVESQYPIFLDVTSKHKNEEGYRYRYEIDPLKEGAITLSEIADSSLARWLRQVKSGLSDQAAMIVGFYDRKKIDGFKNHHTVSTQAMTAKYGLEPETYSVLWDGKIAADEPLEGDLPRFMSIQVPEGISRTVLSDESNQEKVIDLFPISPRVIHVIQE